MFKALDRWLPGYLRHRPPPAVAGPRHIMFCLCDHYEPRHHATPAEALARVQRWRREYPPLATALRDHDGRPLRYSFFYPIEQYVPELIEPLAELADAGLGEVEVHLHHADDTAATLRAALEQGKTDLLRHGCLSRDPAGQARYGFIHGNWTLDNAHPEGRHCGVSDELGVLAATGCYADFTLPSAPSPTQTRMVNAIYWAKDTPAPKSHDTGVRAAVRPRGTPPPGDLLLVQGPLGLNWERRKWGLLPRVENADLTAVNPPRPDRLRLWLRLGIHVQQRPEWLFIKVHTHGAMNPAADMLLGAPMAEFGRHLLSQYNDGRSWCTHFVTARELTNIVLAAEAGETGDPGQYRDYHLRAIRGPSATG